MAAVGETLRQERLRRNLDLEQISRELKISARFLDAIENDQFGKLPGLIFAKSFVRQYARYLNLDDAELGAEVQRILEPEPQLPPPEERPEPNAFGARPLREYANRQLLSWRSLLPSAALVVLVVLVSSGVYVFWQQARTRKAPQVEPAQTAVNAPRAQQLRPESAAGAETTAPVESAQLRSEADRLHDANRAPQDQSQSATAAGAVADQTAAGGEGDPNAPLRLKLIAQEPVWVRASNNGKYLFSETLDANQTREFDGAGQMELVLGNAGGIDIEVNGKSVGAIGPKGQVRTVHISSGGFKIVPRKPSAPLDLF